MFVCERCGSKFNSLRAATIRDCPRCLLRDDVASPLKAVPNVRSGSERAKAEEPAPDQR